MNPAHLAERRAAALLVAIAAGLFACALAQEAPAPKPPKVLVSQERPSALYRTGETVAFTIRCAFDDGAPPKEAMTVFVSLTLDGGKALAETARVEIGAAPHRVEHTMTQPGFVSLNAIGRKWQGDTVYVSALAVAACEPEKIAPVVAMPDDFDAFWTRGREELARIPPDVRMERIQARCDDKQDTFKVSFANINDTRIYGYLLVPKTGRKSYPAWVSVAPAGVGKPREDFLDGRMNAITGNEAICLFMGVYDHDLGLAPEFYKSYRNREGGVAAAVDAPEKYFFYRAILGIDRAIDWLAARKDFDGKHLVYHGGSQGGGMGLVLAGLNRNITAASIGIPGLCDHTAFLQGRAPGWPKVLGDLARRKMTPEQIAAMTKILPYFDAVNFSRKIRVPVIVCMGYLDTTCVPSSVYAAYNVITAPKSILPDPNQGHGVSRENAAILARWIREKLGLPNDTAAPKTPPALAEGD